MFGCMEFIMPQICREAEYLPRVIALAFTHLFTFDTILPHCLNPLVDYLHCLDTLLVRFMYRTCRCQCQMAYIAERSMSSTAHAEPPAPKVQQSSPFTTDANRSQSRTTHLRQFLLSLQSSDTFTAMSESDQQYDSTAVRQLCRATTCPNCSQQTIAQFPPARSQPIPMHHQHECYQCPGPPSMRRLPTLSILDDKVENSE